MLEAGFLLRIPQSFSSALYFTLALVPEPQIQDIVNHVIYIADALQGDGACGFRVRRVVAEQYEPSTALGCTLWSGKNACRLDGGTSSGLYRKKDKFPDSCTTGLRRSLGSPYGVGVAVGITTFSYAFGVFMFAGLGK